MGAAPLCRGYGTGRRSRKHGNESVLFFEASKGGYRKDLLDYLTSYRIEKAKKRLTSTDLSVSDVGHSVGYADSNYFTKAFKKW